ncbi:hypothetical protein SDRG_01802 [Saprolegnia diclina VS20]|uniref:Uncharacterized protein n=1 Tax=Saprolegnia diclina (strain VS20) TaxID=1156394 RepID=T0R312_SAPDV|nr:hypothetical protein SDRG_01802 [Saprolegnia diclina VS20]EQC40730.1 hypothetical protein SDRG_01802 [Saprolegnia diclina VS20]|eukprot:XP_008605574.1 hypothetical protein SDRG_01802 [Saprolegnia diclina VS20]
MAGATPVHYVNSTPPTSFVPSNSIPLLLRTPIRATTPQSLPPRTPQSMPPPHREAVSSDLDDDLPGPLPLSQSTGSSTSSQEINVPLSARSPVPMSVQTLQAAMTASEKKIMASTEARFNRMGKEVQAIRRLVDGGGIEEQIDRVSLDERPDSNNVVQREAATDILQTFLAGMKASLADNEAKVNIVAIRHNLADVASRAAILERPDGVSQELEAARRATAKTILESKRLKMLTSFIISEHRIDPDNPVLHEPSQKCLAGECDGFLYIVDERTGLPVLMDSDIYPMPLPMRCEERLKLICSLLVPCEYGVKFMKAAKTVADVVPVPGLLLAVPIMEKVLSGLKMAVKGLNLAKEALSTTLVEFVRKGDPKGNFHGVVQHARDDGSVFYGGAQMTEPLSRACCTTP